jgi:MFS family permease
MSDFEQQAEKKPVKWSMGILNDQETEEVPGSILLLSKVSEYNEPLGLRNAPARTSASSLPSPYLTPSQRSSFSRRRPSVPEKKCTPDGKIILEPQPDDSLNDPLNWKMWRRDLALFSLGFYCMVGGGMTPILAAGFNEVAEDFNISVPQVALTTGLYMMGLGIGSAILSPTAILYGKRPVYLCAAICFVASAIWCSESPNFASLVVARIFMGLAVSSVECLPSATVAEIFFLHEKAYRLGIYTLLLLGGKNLVPLVSAAIIQGLHWRWAFRIVAIVVAFGFCLLLAFVPETFWDRTPRPHKHTVHRFPSKLSLFRSGSITLSPTALRRPSRTTVENEKADVAEAANVSDEPKLPEKHAHFQADPEDQTDITAPATEQDEPDLITATNDEKLQHTSMDEKAAEPPAPQAATEQQPGKPLRIAIPPEAHQQQSGDPDYFALAHPPSSTHESLAEMGALAQIPTEQDHEHDPSAQSQNPYTDVRRVLPPTTFLQQLKPWNGRLRKDSWFRVAVRPFILFCYPSILWSALVYSLSIGWLIVLSESVSTIYEESDSYNFTSLQTGLVYISPFVGGILGTAVAGKISDIMVRYLARKNGGIYEPEFRLVMGIPIALTTTIGLMGYGWSAQERDLWIVPTIFFGLISFGCSLGSTTAITFAVDSYRQYAGEALVTLNFSKNIFHGLMFSLFFNRWLDSEGSKDTFVAIGGIQLACLLTTIPMYIYGKRARMWTVRRNLMEKW